MSGPIEVKPGKDNPLDWRDDRSFDIHDAAGKIGHLAGYDWGGGEFRVTRVEITQPGKSLSPGEWKGVLRGLREQLPETDFISGNRAGEGGELHPACEKFMRLAPSPSTPDIDLDR